MSLDSRYTGYWRSPVTGELLEVRRGDLAPVRRGSAPPRGSDGGESGEDPLLVSVARPSVRRTSYDRANATKEV